MASNPADSTMPMAVALPPLTPFYIIAD